MTLKAIPLANTLAIMALVLHSFFHAWAILSSQSYVAAVRMSVAGLQLSVNATDASVLHFVLGTIGEVASFWLFGAAVATLYNALVRRAEPR